VSEEKSEWPFDLWLKTAVRGFGLSPTEFWSMSVRDWLNLLASSKAHGLARNDLSNLMNTYPDNVQKRDKHD
jgi:Phage tail assembly chaperone protein, TAC